MSSFGDRHQDRELERGVMLCKAIRMYSYQSEGMFPENLGRLVESRKATAEMTLYDPTGSGSAVPWIYFPGLDENSERNMIVLAAPEVVNGRPITVFVHGGGMRMLESDYQLRVAQKPKPKLKPMPAPESEPESEPLPELETDEPAMEEEAEDVEVEVEEGEATSMESR